MSFQQAELERRLAGLIRWGTVHSVDYPAARCRLECGTMITDWLPWCTMRASNDRSWWAPEVGEQGAVLSPSGESAMGFVIFGFYQSAHPAPANSPDIHRNTYSDGARIEYDRANHVLTAYVPGKAQIRADDSIWADAGTSITATAGTSITANAGTTVDAAAGQRITLAAPLIELEGNIKLIGPVTSGGRGGEAHSMTIQGPIEHTKGNYVNPNHDVLVQGISSATHTHQCPHGGDTSGPS